MAAETDRELADLRAQLTAAARKHLPEPAASLATELARPAVRLVHDASETTSRLGGRPLLRADAAWPDWDGTPLSFLAVVDLADLTPYATDVRLPASGYLNFFYEAEEQQAWGFEPSHRAGWRVMFTPRGDGPLRATPPGATEFTSIGLSPRQTLTVPGWEEPTVAEIVPPHRPRPVSKLEELRTRQTRAREEQQRDAYFAFLDEWSEVIDFDSSPNHQIGGWPRLQQNPIWKECAVASQGLPLGTSAQWNDPRVPELVRQADDWRLLLQLDTDEDAGWMWGDVGTLYFATRDSVAVPSAFDLAWMVFQCG